ncbi:MAG: hypothetical protein ATN31_10220 [Candidatus Epulonipiscioides saccharophilum]|nr:MAG: hypothetical protein ATN31_10220 [Epulopiscium sp. AS2M-Bin001]
MSNIKIFVAHDEEKTITVDNPIYQNVITQNVENSKFIQMNTGDNISDKYKKYQELTIQYWAWKNIDADYYGLCTQNKYLSFSTNNIRNNQKTNFEFPAPYFDEHPTIDPPIKFEYLNNANIQKLNLFEQAMKDTIESYDMIITSHLNWDITIMQQFDVPSVLDNKLKVALELIDEFSPEFSKVAHEYFNGYVYYPGQLYVMSKDLFNDYCKWNFKILDELEKRIDFSHYSVEGLKVLYYISERLLGVYYTYLKNQNKYKLKEVDWCEIEHVETQDPILPAFIDNKEAILFCFDNNFIIPAAATIMSLINTSTDENQYDIICFNKNLAQTNKDLLSRLTKEKNNISLRFYDIGFIMSNYPSPHLRENIPWSIDVYSKFLIFEILASYNKVLYLDTDLILMDDISYLLNLDLTGYYLAACPDLGIISNSSKMPWMYNYLTKKINLTNEFIYTNAGVSLFNIQEIINDQINFGDNLLQTLFDTAKQLHLAQEQDIINELFHKKTYYLDLNWNIYSFLGTSKNTISKKLYKEWLPEYLYKQCIAAIQNPKIIHYVADGKPWNYPDYALANYWWDAIRGTEIYELAINLQIKNTATKYTQKIIQDFLNIQ